MTEIHDDMFKSSIDVPYFGTMQPEDDREISILKWQFELLLKTIDEESVFETTAV
jgi:hypothetical protein